MSGGLHTGSVHLNPALDQRTKKGPRLFLRRQVLAGLKGIFGNLPELAFLEISLLCLLKSLNPIEKRKIELHLNRLAENSKIFELAACHADAAFRGVCGMLRVGTGDHKV